MLCISRISLLTLRPHRRVYWHTTNHEPLWTSTLNVLPEINTPQPEITASSFPLYCQQQLLELIKTNQKEDWIKKINRRRNKENKTSCLCVFLCCRSQWESSPAQGLKKGEIAPDPPILYVLPTAALELMRRHWRWCVQHRCHHYSCIFRIFQFGCWVSNNLLKLSSAFRRSI